MNPDFENGNQGIITTLDYFGDCSSNGNDNQSPNKYSIPFSGGKPSDCNMYWTPNLSAQSGRSFMIADYPEAVLGADIWCHELEVKPNNDYLFSGHFANVFNEIFDEIDPAFRVFVKGDDSELGVIYKSSDEINLDEGSGWKEGKVYFNSNENQKISICIQNDNNGRGGRDLALDNLSLRIVSCEEQEANENTNDTEFYDCDERIENHNASLLNGSFEDGTFQLWDDGATNYGANQVDYWDVASWGNNIDLFDSGHEGVHAYEGEVYAEANSFDESSLYQDIALSLIHI